MQRSARKRALVADQEQSPLRERDVNSTSLFFPSGQRRKDLDQQDNEEAFKRLRIDAPVFSAQGLNQGLAAMEPVATDALMGLAIGKLVYYGGYFEQNKLLRELTFERESRHRFGPRRDNNYFQAVASSGGFGGGGSANDDDDDL